jgi:CheY-like chemotaxis protein
MNRGQETFRHRMIDIVVPQILVIDDESAVRLIPAKPLPGEGYLVDEASHAGEALGKPRSSRRI